MKKLFLILLCLTVNQFFYAQQTIVSQNFEDSNSVIKELQYFEDTLWVMDSSHSYSLNYGSFELTSKYNITSRDERGNKLTALRRQLNLSFQIFENSGLDSVNYFEGTNNIHYEKTYAWNNLDEIWMDNKFTTFNNNLDVTESYDKWWNKYEHQYSSGRRTIYYYDDSVLKSRVYQKYLPNSDFWEPIEKIEYLKNELGKDSVILTLEWSLENGQWENKNKLLIGYDEFLNPSDFLTKIWDSEFSIWNKTSYTTYSYNLNFDIDTVSIFDWNELENEWIYNRMITHEFIEPSRISQRLTRVYLQESNEWKNVTMYKFFYNGLNTLSERYDGDTLTGNWVPTSRQLQSLTSFGESDTVQYETWSVDSQNWIYSHRRINVFDDKQNQTETSIQEWKETNNDWTIIQQTLYFWSPFKPLGTNEFTDFEVNVYPNPAKSFITLNLPQAVTASKIQIEIFDMNGRSIKKSIHNSSVIHLDITEFDSGIYLVKVQSEEELIIKRIVKQ